jgi:photosystem II stability/assembly factor-like uncharacterized protein
MASTWAATANNETVSFNNLQDAVNTGVFRQKATIPVSNEQITKTDANVYVNIDNAFAPYSNKASNQLVVKSNLRATAVINNLLFQGDMFGIANNQTTSNPVQVITGKRTTNTFPFTDGVIYRSTDFGENYSFVVNNVNALNRITFMPAFRHASYLTVPPFVVVGINGTILTNSVVNASSWITISSPTSQDLYDSAFNDSGVGIIVGDRRILRTTTNNRINAWLIEDFRNSVWRAVASNGSRFVAVGDNSSVITGDSSGTIWTSGTMPPSSPSTVQLRGVTAHVDGFWYAVGNSGFEEFLMKSTESFGFSWEIYTPTGESFLNQRLNSINSIGGRLVLSASFAQYEIINNVVTRYFTGNYEWFDNVKEANSNGFDMSGRTTSGGAAYSNF